MLPDFEKEHEKLYSGASLILGKTFWNILRADTLVMATEHHPSLNLKDFVSLDVSKALTRSADEISLEEIHWWVFQQENDHETLLNKTQAVLPHLQKLKVDAEKLDPQSPKTYSGVIKELKKFTESHSEDIKAFYDYVFWLASVDPVAPAILFSNQRWGSTRRSDRLIFVIEPSIDKDIEKVKLCTEVALGLRDKMQLKYIDIFGEMDYENYERDPEEYVPGRVNRKGLIFRISHQTFKELGIFLELIRDSLRDIIKEIEGFHSEKVPIVRKLKFGVRTKPVIRFCLVQLNFSLKRSTEKFGFIMDNESLLKEKIFSATQTAKENDTDILCFPELSFKGDWVKELLPLSHNMVIVCGSYYEDSHNKSPVIIDGQVVEPSYNKISPSPSECGVIHGEEMKPGKIVYIYQTEIGIFSTLTCIDYAQWSHYIINQAKGELDFIVNPCYDENIQRFQSQANSDCENYNLTIIQSNRADHNGDKYGKSCIISKEHRTIIDQFTSGHFRDSDDEKYLLVKLRNEEMVIADINFSIRAPSVDLPVSYLGRLKILKHYDYSNSEWLSRTNT